MATQRLNDLDELNRPPQPRRTVAVRALPRAAGAEHITGNEDAEMGERTVADILLEQVKVIDAKIDDVVKNQLEQKGQTTRELDALRRDVTDLKEWRMRIEELPEKRRERQQQEQTAWWQTTNGKINLALFALVIITTIAPFVAAHWH